MSTYHDSSSLIAGASAEAHGVLTGWRGHGDFTRERFLDVATVADIPREWLPPVKDAAVQLSRAAVHVAGTTYESKVVRKVPLVRDPTWSDTEFSEQRLAWEQLNAWTCRRALVRRPRGTEVRAGQNTALAVVVVTLWEPEGEAPRLDFDTMQGYEAVREAVAQHFEQRIASQRYTAADVTKWLGDTLRRKLQSVRYGIGWYIPRETRTVAEQLCDALRGAGWGTSWCPLTPVAHSAALSRGVAQGLQEEVFGITADLANSRKTAQDAGRADIGPRAVETFHKRYNECLVHVNRYRLILGEESHKELLDIIADAIIALDGAAADIESTRAA